MPDEDDASPSAITVPDSEEERAACTPTPLRRGAFNRACKLPHGLTTAHLATAMGEFLDFLGFVNAQLRTKDIARFETLLMPANFSSMVGEFMVAGIAKHSGVLVKNRYHNGHPDLVPAGLYPGDAKQYGDHGIEVKASRYDKGWQGHNPEASWLMVFVFESGRPTDVAKGVPPRPFSFKAVYGAQLTKEDWTFAGRSETSRRTITAAVNRTGYEKMVRNWLYRGV